MNQRTLRVSVAATAALLLTLSGCGSGEDDSAVAAGDVTETGDALASAAGKEGKLNLYCSPAPAVCDGIAAAFEKKYPDVTVAVTRASSNIPAKYAAEKKSRSETADVVVVSDLEFVKAALKDGLLTTFGEAGYLPDSFPTEWTVDAEGVSGTPFISDSLGIAVNTDKVSKSEMPKDWSDVTDAAWKGRLGSFANEGPAFAGLYGTLGDNVPGFLDGLSGQDVEWVMGGIVAVTEALGAGQFDAQVLASPSVVALAQEQGAPVEFIYPESGVVGPAHTFTLDPEPAHPSAQKLFAEFVTSEELAAVLTTVDVPGAFVETDYKYIVPTLDYYSVDGGKPTSDKLGGK